MPHGPEVFRSLQQPVYLKRSCRFRRAVHPCSCTPSPSMCMSQGTCMRSRHLRRNEPMQSSNRYRSRSGCMFRRRPIPCCREVFRSLPQPACRRCRGRPRRACRFRRCRRRRSIRRSHCTGMRSHPLRRSEPMRSCMPIRPRLTRRCRRLPTPRLPEEFRMRRCRRYPTRSCFRRSGSCPRSRRCTRRRRFQYM